MADLDSEVKKALMLSIEKCAGKELPAGEKSSCKSNAVNKLLKEACDFKTANAVDATIFCKYCDKATKKLTVDDFLNKVLPNLAQHNVQESKKVQNPSIDDPAVQTELTKLKQKIVNKYHEWASSEKGKNMAVVDRLTDVKGYTGAHKERFDAESGKGKGMEGRMDKQDNSGYVGNYKGAGTYDGKHK